MALQTTMMDSVCTIFRPSSVSRDANQGTVQNFTVLSGPLACSQQQAGVGVQKLWQQRNAEVSTTLYFPDDPGTAVNDFIIAVDDYVGQSNNYLVQGRSFPVARGELWGVDCQLIQSPETPATVVLPTVTAVTRTGATLGGNVTDDGGTPLLEVGVVLSTTSVNNYPVVGGSGVSKIVTAAAEGSFAIAVTPLAPGTTYSFAPYAINRYGGQLCTTYGQVVEFSTLP